ncbi:unnamed protein product [Ilex paraguariensis]|uniref:Uncharacterized protein n=1 Tax=Ilex paraguariensis TaxID=185542 RepID=A0ABC8TQ41_9AQUA
MERLDIDELVSQIPKSCRQSLFAIDEVFTQVMGPERPGRVRTYGLRPLEEIQAMQCQLNDQLSRHKDMEAKHLEIEAQQAQMEKQMSQIQHIFKAKFDAQQRQFEAQQRQLEVLFVQMQAMGMPIPKPTGRNISPL